LHVVKELGMQDDIRGLGWLASVVGVGILLLVAGGEIASRTDDDPSTGGRLASLVTCVLSETVAGPPPTPAGISETVTPDCAEPTPYHPNRASITC